MSVKYQITLPEDLAVELKRTAGRLNVPLAQFIRETMEQRLKAVKSQNGVDPHRSRAASHPLRSIIGLMDGEDSNLAARVDEILYR